MDSNKSESLDGKGGLNSSDSKMSVSDSDILVLSATGSASGPGYRTDKTNDICTGSYGSAIVFLRNTCEKSEKKSPKCGNCYNHYNQVSPEIKP